MSIHFGPWATVEGQETHGTRPFEFFQCLTRDVRWRHVFGWTDSSGVIVIFDWNGFRWWSCNNENMFFAVKKLNIKLLSSQERTWMILIGWCIFWAFSLPSSSLHQKFGHAASRSFLLLLLENQSMKSNSNKPHALSLLYWLIFSMPFRRILQCKWIWRMHADVIYGDCLGITIDGFFVSQANSCNQKLRTTL